jgi:hypothetical protein
VAIIPESLDTALFDPDLWPATGLPGKKKYAFLAVFKLEDRKGWKEVVSAYVQVDGGAGAGGAAAGGAAAGGRRPPARPA